MSWFANLAIIAAWILTNKKSVYPVFLSVLACALAFSFYLNGSLVGSSSGSQELATKYLVGYWLWLLSMFVYLIYHLIILVIENRKTHYKELS